MKTRMFVALFLVLFVVGCASERLKTKTEFSVTCASPTVDEFIDNSSIETTMTVTILSD